MLINNCYSGIHHNIIFIYNIITIGYITGGDHLLQKYNPRGGGSICN